MPTNDDDQKSLKAIRARARELHARGEPLSDITDAEVIAALIDGTISLDDIDDETLERCLQTHGTDHIVRTMMQERRKAVEGKSDPLLKMVKEESMTSEVPKAPVYGMPSRPAMSWWRQHSGWIAAAASIAFVSTAVMWTGRNVPQPDPEPVSGLSVAFQWPSHPPFDPGTVKPWGPTTPTLPNGLPDFTKGGGTLGAGGEDRFTPWRLATVIIRTEEGMGSGAFISADGWLLTNFHVVESSAQGASMTGDVPMVDVIVGRKVDGRIKPRAPVKARVYRVDSVHDLALLKLEAMPEGMKDVPFFKIAKDLREGEDCFVIGSQANGPAWWLRSGNVSVLFDFPNELSQMAAGAATSDSSVERTRATVVVTDTRISGGDSGGPLLNTKGELIGLTFATPVNRTAGSVGWHIALEHLRGIVAGLPSQPEGVPFDPWTIGLSNAHLGTPQQADGDRDGRIDTLIFPYVADVTDSAGQTAPQAVAFTLFVDLSQRAKPNPDASSLVPAGLWSSEDRGNFRHDIFLTVRADDRFVVGYTNAQGVVDDIRIGTAKEMNVTLVWHRTPQGQWQASRPATGTAFLDTARISEINVRKVSEIFQNLAGNQSESQSPKPSTPPRPDDGAKRGPNKL